MYDWLLFDLDGTITNTKEGITKCIKYAFDYMGEKVDDLDSLSKYIGPPLVESFSNHFDPAGVEIAVKKFRERYETKGIKECELFPGIVEVLKAAKASGKHTALATSKPQKFAEQILRDFNIDQYIDLPVGAIDDTTTKADVVNMVLDRAGIREEKNRALMIGDRKYDIEGANLCGIDSLGVYYGFADPGELEKEGAKYIVNTTAELEEFVKQDSLAGIEKWLIK